MVNLIIDFIKRFTLRKSVYSDKEIKHSVNKYYNTYKLLEKYDTAAQKKAPILVDSENMREYFCSLH